MVINNTLKQVMIYVERYRFIFSNFGNGRGFPGNVKTI